ncbi:hypothetical protein yc1106_05352 [Curvularia clavata]|uniref:BTB domain-containing protein n=1 Tax=Curvularia clavata TaxID=95742 RepID=A0A9Q8ZD33_CURCL|nr:hypothetical protein yc1106_05352 [Curvularia clavata]
MTEKSTQAHKTLYQDPTFSDITIRQTFQGKHREYLAHKAVLCNHSGWFMRALTGNFKESAENTIEVHDDNPEAFEAMMYFFYHMDFDKQSGLFDKTRNPRSLIEELTDIVDCYSLADKYDAGPFLDALLERFKQVTAPFSGNLTENNIKMLVHAHYPYCTAPMCSMSEPLVSFMFKNDGVEIFGSKMVQELILQYGNFGTDLLVLGMRTGKLTAPKLWNPILW